VSAEAEILRKYRTIAVVGLSSDEAREASLEVVMDRCIRAEHRRLRPGLQIMP
jgi:predicted CoA-binding protein